MRISDWSSDVCSSDLAEFKDGPLAHLPSGSYAANAAWLACAAMAFNIARAVDALGAPGRARARWASVRTRLINVPARIAATGRRLVLHLRSEEHTSELQSLMRISYAVFCLKNTHIFKTIYKTIIAFQQHYRDR